MTYMFDCYINGAAVDKRMIIVEVIISCTMEMNAGGLCEAADCRTS